MTNSIEPQSIANPQEVATLAAHALRDMLELPVRGNGLSNVVIEIPSLKLKIDLSKPIEPRLTETK